MPKHPPSLINLPSHGGCTDNGIIDLVILDVGVEVGVEQVVADVCEKDVRDFQAKSGSSGSCPLSFIS